MPASICCCACAPLLAQVPDCMALLALVGLLTALYGCLCGLVQTDVKSRADLRDHRPGRPDVRRLRPRLVRRWPPATSACTPPGAPTSSCARRPACTWSRRRPGRCRAGWRRGSWLYTAALQRFWLDRLADRLLARPTQALARDMRGLRRATSSTALVGLPARPRGSRCRVGDASAATDGQVMRGRGRPGAAGVAADRLQRSRRTCCCSGGGGWAASCSASAQLPADADRSLLEQPRYLMLMVMATFVVIL